MRLDFRLLCAYKWRECGRCGRCGRATAGGRALNERRTKKRGRKLRRLKAPHTSALTAAGVRADKRACFALTCLAKRLLEAAETKTILEAALMLRPERVETFFGVFELQTQTIDCVRRSPPLAHLQQHSLDCGHVVEALKILAHNVMRARINLIDQNLVSAGNTRFHLSYYLPLD